MAAGQKKFLNDKRKRFLNMEDHYSDFSSLINNKLLSLSSYDMIINKKIFFVREKQNNIYNNFNLYIFYKDYIIFINSSKKTYNNLSYKYDDRDRYSYWF